VQHDESLNDIDSIILQVEAGHRYLNSTFGIPLPRVAWQLDPFGHSSFTPVLAS
jgi:hypothetical protein